MIYTSILYTVDYSLGQGLSGSRFWSRCGPNKVLKNTAASRADKTSCNITNTSCLILSHK